MFENQGTTSLIVPCGTLHRHHQHHPKAFGLCCAMENGLVMGLGVVVGNSPSQSGNGLNSAFRPRNSVKLGSHIPPLVLSSSFPMPQAPQKMPQGETTMTGPGTGRLAARDTDECRQPSNLAHCYDRGVANAQVGDWCLTPGDCPGGIGTLRCRKVFLWMDCAH